MQKKTDAERMCVLFAGSDRAHGTHGEPYQEKGKRKWEIKKTARTVEGPATGEMWAAHLSGERPLGVVPIREDGTCQWGSIDVDSYEDNPTLVASATEAGLVPCRSKSGGLHLFLFLAEPIAAAEVQAALAALRDSLGLPENTEIFPKQTRLGEDDKGNWICMPYLGTTYESRLREQVGLKKNGLDMQLSEFLRAAEKSRWKAADARRLVRGRRSPAVSDDLPLPGAPLCLRERASNGVEEGIRNDTLFAMGTYVSKVHGLKENKLREKLYEYNHAYMRPPLVPDEVDEVCKSLGRKKEREYRRDGRPICAKGTCDRPECRLTLSGDQVPTISRIVKITKDPPHWNIWIGNQVVENLSTEEATNLRVFRRVCLERLSLYIPAKTAKLWDEMWQTTTIEEETADDEDVGADDAFHQLLEDFLTNRQRGERIEDIFAGRPWQDEQERRHYFRMSDLTRFVHTHGSPALKKIADAAYAKRQIKRCGGGAHGPRTIRGKSVRLWWVPSDAVQAPPAASPPKGGL